MAEAAKPSVALIGGTGNLGPGLALRWALAGHSVIIGSRLAPRAQDTARELNEKLPEPRILGLDNVDAVKHAEICVLTVVADAHDAALEGLKMYLPGKILVDATARMSFPDLTPPAPPAAAQIAQEILGSEVRVVAAFQNVPAAALKKSPDQSLESDVLVCSDDLEAAEVTMGLARAAGMNAFYAGGLDKAIVVEGLTSLLVAINKHYKVHGSTLKIGGIEKSKKKKKKAA